MTIDLGRIEAFVVHYGEGTVRALPRPLCVQGGGRYPLGLSTFTTDRAKVTCPGCIEWLHA